MVGADVRHARAAANKGRNARKTRVKVYLWQSYTPFKKISHLEIRRLTKITV